ncbi:MAG: SURF1 family protein [Actinomycetota bacterium]
MLGLLRRHRETIGLWLLAVIFAAACVLLGRWQLHRYQDKHGRAALVARNYDATPVELAALLPPAATSLDPGDQWRPVRARGTYDVTGTVLVRNRPRTGGGADAVYGYEVVVPLVLDDGSALLVDRGWLPNGSLGSTPGQAPDAVPAPATGRVEVVARLKAPEPERSADLPRGQVGSVAVGRIGALSGLRVAPAYAVLVSETPSAATTPLPLDRPVVDGGEGINASYAVQWVVFALLGLGFPVWVGRRRRAALAEDAAAGAPSPAAAPQPARVRRPRIWDADGE